MKGQVDELIGLKENVIRGKLSPAGTGLDMVRAMQVGARVRIEVQDTGVGIPAEKQQLIFEKFRQGETFVTRSQQGSGLGLTLAKELVEHMGGQIGVTSTLGEGATFHIELPSPIVENYPT